MDPTGTSGLAPTAPVTPWMYGLRAYQRDQPRFFQHLVERYGDVVHWRALLDIYVINHPEDVKRVLSAPSARFSKDTIDYRILAASLGRGLVTNDGAPWAQQRKLMQPMFHNRAIHPFDEPINRLTDALAERWSTLPAGQVVMVEREMGKLAFEIVGTTLFGTDIEQHAAEISEVLEVINVPTHELRSLLLVLAPWLPTGHRRRLRLAIARLDRVVFGLINGRRASGAQREDILERLLAVRDEESGAGMSEQQIRDEVVTLLLAGHETSSNALAWTFYLLTQHREVEAKLLAELALVLAGRPATSADLAQLPYLKQVVQESLRILPPVWAIARRSHQAEVFQGHHVPAGAYLIMLPFTLHRHPEFWPEPERFDPERFDPNSGQSRHSYSYLPFAAGPRTCIGAGMAMLEIQLVLANLLPRFHLAVAPGRRIETVAKVTLSPKYGMPMIITPRAAGTAQGTPA